MEEHTNSSFISFDSPKEQSSIIKVIGVGGGGNNAVNHMFRQGIEGVDFIVCNTDIKALNASPVPNKISLGYLGAGNKPERARKAAMEHADEIREVISHNTKMLFITAGMGGGTGTGAAPVIAEIAKSIELEEEDTKRILVVAIVTIPFSWENKRRREQAREGIAELRKYVDSIIVINNDKLRSFGDLDIDEAFCIADDVLLTAAKGIAEIITVTSMVNIDFQDVNTVMENSGTALMGTGSGKGDNRAMKAIEGATSSVLLDDSDIRGAKNILLYFSYSSDHKIKMDEIGAITDFLSEKTDGTADVIWGAGADDSLDDELRVTLVATGFEKSTQDGPQIIDLAEPETIEVADKKQEKEPVDNIEPTIITKHADEAVAPTTKEEPVRNAKESTQPVGRILQFPTETLVEEDVDVLAKLDNMPSRTSQPTDIHIVKDEPAPAKQPAVNHETSVAPEKPKEESHIMSAFKNDNDLEAAAERIRRIHDLLRNNPNGAEIVQGMNLQQMTDAPLYEGNHSSAKEASSLRMLADGSIAVVPFLHGSQPD